MLCKCGVLSTFRSSWELLSVLVSTNRTQILLTRKQMEWDNNEQRNNQFNNHNKQDKNN